MRVLLAAILVTAGLASTGTPEREVSASSVPDATDGLVLHWDASVAASLRDTGGGAIDNGEAVGSWVDLVSGVTAAAVTSVGGVAQPIYRATGGPNGAATIEFDGASQGLETLPLALFPNASSGLTVILVFETDNISSQKFLLMHATNNCVTNVEIGVAAGNVVSGNWGIHRGCGHADVTPGGTITTGTTSLVSTTLGTTGATPNHVTHRVNGIPRITQTSGSGFVAAGSYSTAAAPLYIGFRRDTPVATPNSFFDGRLSEIMVFDRPVPTQRLVELERRVASDYSLALFTPGAPTSVTASASASSTTVSWQAPDNGGSPILSYDATVSAAGVDVATCSQPAGTLSCVISGLTTGFTHTVTVTAANALGTGGAATASFTVPVPTATSSPPPPPPPPTTAPVATTTPTTSSTTIPTATPTTEPQTSTPTDSDIAEPPVEPETRPDENPQPGIDPELDPGFVVARDETTVLDVVLVQIAPSAWRVTSNAFVLDLAARLADGREVRVDSSGLATLTRGGLLETSGVGFAPGTMIDVWLFSEPRLMGRIAVDATGSFSGSVPVPDGLAIGNHNLQVTGQSREGLRRSVSLGVRIIGGDTVISAPRTELPSTGAVPVGLLGSFGAVVLGLLARGLRRRLIATR